MLTGAQIRQGRDLLGWSRSELCRRAFLKLDLVEQAEQHDGAALLIYGHEIAIRRVCGTAGVEVIDHPPSARLTKGQQEPFG